MSNDDVCVYGYIYDGCRFQTAYRRRLSGMVISTSGVGEWVSTELLEAIAISLAPPSLSLSPHLWPGERAQIPKTFPPLLHPARGREKRSGGVLYIYFSLFISDPSLG